MTNTPGKWTPEEIAELGPLLRSYIEGSGTTSAKRLTCRCCGERYRCWRGRPSPFCATCRPEQRALAGRRRRRHPVFEPRVCAACEQQFWPRRSWAKNCTPACAQRAYRQRVNMR